jgi:plasmid maintenance system antidote protein VapI
MYGNYLKYHHIPCGAVIDRIRAREHLTQRELAERSGILCQRINDFITGRRKISPEQSLKLEDALGIERKGFFCQIQTNHEIYLAVKRMEERQCPDYSKYRKALFWDTDFNSIDWQRNAAWIIQRVFEYGNENEIKETVRFYGEKAIETVLLTLSDSWNAGNRKHNMEKYLYETTEN